MFQMFQKHLNWTCRVNQWPRITGQSEVTKIEKFSKKSFSTNQEPGKTYALILNLGTYISGTDLNYFEHDCS